MKKQLIPTAFLLLLSAFIGGNLFAQNVVFGDPKFKDALLKNKEKIDINNDGEISKAEAKAFSGKILVQSKGITDLKGIEEFPNITELNCSENELTTLDVSKNTKLTSLFCGDNRLIILDVSKNIQLTGELDCSGNKLTTLDVSKNTKLTSLFCSHNRLIILDVSKNTQLTGELDCSYNSELIVLNLKNGVSAKMKRIRATDIGAPIKCIQVDDVDEFKAKWKGGDLDEGALEKVSTNCIIEISSITVASKTKVYDITEKAGSLTLVATVAPSNALIKKVKWSVSDNKIASITPGNNNEAILTAISNGKVTVTAMAQDGSGKRGEKVINITNQPKFVPVEDVTVSTKSGKSAITTEFGELTMTATVTPADASIKKVTWSVRSVSDNRIAFIRPGSNNEAILTGIANGKVTVTATAQDGSGKSGGKVIRITGQSVPVEGVTVSTKSGKSAITTKGGKLIMTAKVTPDDASNKKVKWSVSDNKIASITLGNNNEAILTAISNGKVTVTAMAQDDSGKSGEKVINITGQPEFVPVATVAVSTKSGKSAITTKFGELTMTATVTPANASVPKVTWSVSDNRIAFIRPGSKNEAILTGIANGKVTVTATAQDGSGKSGEKVINITNQPKKFVPVQIIDVSTRNGKRTITTASGQLAMTVMVIPENASIKKVTWSVSDDKIASITPLTDSKALLSAKADGKVTVTAKAQDGSENTWEDVITISNQNPTSIDDISGSNALSVYPNPATDRLVISSDLAIRKIEIKDLLGKTVKTLNSHKNIDISSLTPSQYLIQVTTDTEVFTRKFVKN